MQWIIDNKEWLFSGAGIILISLVFKLFKNKEPNIKQVQKSGKKSTSYQAGYNITIEK